MEKNNKREFVLVNKKAETPDVTSLFFKPMDNLGYKFISGQYVVLKLPTISNRAKSYTISSSPEEKLICLTIKRKGAVSNNLIDMPVSTKILFDGPYGNFYPENNVKEIVMLAGGIGITPFYSIIKNRLKSDKKAKICLFYSNKTLKDITFFEELNSLAKNNDSFKVIYCLTQEKTKNLVVREYKRIDEKMLKKYLVTVNNKCYYVCGSVSFVNDMWKLLKKIGVLEENIFTESFF